MDDNETEFQRGFKAGWDECANAAAAIGKTPINTELLYACKIALDAFEKNHCIDWAVLERAIKRAEDSPAQ